MLEKITKNLYFNVFLLNKYITLYTVILLSLLILVLFIILKNNLISYKNKTYFSILKSFIIYIYVFILSINFFKFLSSLYKIQHCNNYYFYILRVFEENWAFFSIYNVGLSDSIVLLAIISGMVCIFLLGDKNIQFNLINIIYFSVFILITIVMVYSVNLLILFISFEMIFIPTIYFVYKFGYIKKTDKTIKYLLYWTLSGAFLILTVLCYLFVSYKTLNVHLLSLYTFSNLEKIIIHITLFIGFGIKIPVYPFHFWLTKVHVEAPAGFSIFLSGFLVKTAVYCFYYFSTIFYNQYSNKVILIFIILGIIDSSIKMWSQLDFKKLIAFATIQEMNIIMLFLVLSNNINDLIFIIFVFVHGILSSLMFYLVDIIQKRTTTRNLIELSGVATILPKIKTLTWVILIFFLGFPLTVKFLIEWKVIFFLYTQSLFLTIAVFLVLNVIAVIGFTKQILIILYGNLSLKLDEVVDLSKKDFSVIFILGYILFLLNFFAIYGI